VIKGNINIAPIVAQNTRSRRLSNQLRVRGVAATSGGYGIGGYGASEYGDSDTGVTVTTDGASDVGETNVTLNGSLTDLGGTSFVDVYFEYRHTNVTTWSATATQTASSAGGFSARYYGSRRWRCLRIQGRCVDERWEFGYRVTE